MAAFGTQIYTDLEGFFICLICVRVLLPGCVSAHRFSQIWKDFYLLNLLNLRETLAARLCFGTQIITDLEGFFYLLNLRIYSANNQGVPYRAEISQINSNLYVFQLINLFDLVRFV